MQEGVVSEDLSVSLYLYCFSDSLINERFSVTGNLGFCRARSRSMGLVYEVLRSSTMAATRPFFLFVSICMFGLKTILIVINTLVELIAASINLHLNLFIWVFALLSLPLRLLTAMERERQFREQLQVALMEVECLAWERDELKKQFKIFIKEQKIMNVVLEELEDDYDKAVTNIESLQQELKEMRREKAVVREVKGNYRDEVDATGLNEEDDSTQKEVAVLRSIFSSILSVMVGSVTWKSRDPCLPILVALVVVVGLSLASAIRLFSKFRNKPVSNSIVLVALNCFILGFLSYPTLPHLVRVLSSSLSLR